MKWHEARRIVTSQLSREVLRDVTPLAAALSEKVACSRLGGGADNVADAHVVPKEWTDAISHDIDWEAATEADEMHLKDAECVTPLSSRHTLCDYKRRLLDRVFRDAFPFLESRASESNKRVHFVDQGSCIEKRSNCLTHFVRSPCAPSRIAPMGVHCASGDSSVVLIAQRVPRAR